MAAAGYSDAYYRLMGYHIQGDVRHDFGAKADPVYNIGGKGAVRDPLVNNPPRLWPDGKPLTEAQALTEDGVVDYFMNHPNGAIVIENREARKQGIKEFTIPTQTKTFDKTIPPRLWEGGNDRIGIVHDAGKFITKQLGAQHVLAFGSILDPAPKPNDPTDDPIWFIPAAGSNTVTIPLQEFGIDPAILESITIRSLTAGTVKAEFKIGGKSVDAIAMPSPPAPSVPGGKAKPLNKVEIDQAGFFTSINQAEDPVVMNAQLRSVGIPPGAIEGFKSTYGNYFYLGKTLGDAMLVASCMSSFNNGTIPNPFYGANIAAVSVDGRPKTWSDWGPAPVKPREANNPSMRLDGRGRVGGALLPPTIMMLKTGDKLNDTRAWIKNVASILEQPAASGKGRAVKQYRFFPGVADEASIRRSIVEGYASAIRDIEARYDELIGEFEASTRQEEGRMKDPKSGDRRATIPITRTMLKPEYSNFMSDRIITKDEGRARAGQLVLFIVRCLKALKQQVKTWATEKQAAAAAPGAAAGAGAPTEAMNKAYNAFTATVARSVPQGSLIDVRKDRTFRVNRKIIVCQSLDAGIEGDPLPGLDIALMNAFTAVKEGGNAIERTDLYKRFFVPVIGIPGIQKTIEGKPIVPPPLMAGGSQVGGAGENDTDDWGSDMHAVDAAGNPTPDILVEDASVDAKYTQAIITATAAAGGSKQTGGGWRIRVKKFTNISLGEDHLEKFFPNLFEFKQFLEEELPEPGQPRATISPSVFFQLLIDLHVNQDNAYIEDPVILQNILKEVGTIFRPDQPLVTFVPVEGWETPDALPSTAVLLFAAYTHLINAQNAGAFLVPTREGMRMSVEILDAQSAWFVTQYNLLMNAARLDFRTRRSGLVLLDTPFLDPEQIPQAGVFAKKAKPRERTPRRPAVVSKLNLDGRGEKRSHPTGAPVDGDGDAAFTQLPSNAAAGDGSGAAPSGTDDDLGGGGLQKRRPLYTKKDASVSSETGSGVSNHEGLRKRARTGRASGVRQRTRKSRTRRNRKHLDRV